MSSDWTNISLEFTKQRTIFDLYLAENASKFVVFCDCLVHEFIMWFRSKQFFLTLYKCEANLAQHDNMSLHCKQSYDLC